MSEEVKDALTVGVDPLSLDVVLNHFKLKTNDKGEGCIAFTPTQARSLAFVLLKQADVAQAMSDQVRLNQSVEDYRAKQARARQAIQDTEAIKGKVQ